MFVHLKQSGELLASQGQPGELWTPSGVRASTEKIAAAYKRRSKIGMSALAIVSGAGNVVRGKELSQGGIANGYADVLGRLATLQNTIVLATALEEQKVPVATFMADTMAFRDASLEVGAFNTYDADAIKEAVAKERVILIAGGTGEDNKTTDNAVLAYGARHAEAFPDMSVMVLKGTKYDGVYESDPAKNVHAKRFAEVTAGYMIEHYSEMPAVDRACLDEIQRTGLTLQVYRDGNHDLSTVVIDSSEIGTVIVPGNADVDPKIAA